MRESLPGPRYLEFRSVPREVLATAAFGAKPNAIATSWTDWIKSSVMMVTRKLEPGAIVLGTSMPLMLAEARVAKRERAVARKGWGRMLMYRDCSGTNQDRRGRQYGSRKTARLDTDC